MEESGEHTIFGTGELYLDSVMKVGGPWGKYFGELSKFCWCLEGIFWGNPQFHWCSWGNFRGRLYLDWVVKLGVLGGQGRSWRGQRSMLSLLSLLSRACSWGGKGLRMKPLPVPTSSLCASSAHSLALASASQAPSLPPPPQGLREPHSEVKAVARSG